MRHPKLQKPKAVIFDWAGTMIDFGSFAPMGVFIEAFGSFKIKVTVEEARAPMGMPKRAHIQAMMAMPRIAGAWSDIFGAIPTNSDVDRVYDVFVPMNEKVVAQYATLVPGAKATLDYLKQNQIKVGSTTGYTRSIMAHVLPVAAAQGYTPENVVCSDDLIEGRPGPLGIYKSMVDLAVYPPEAIWKVDDTTPGIAEGKSAGCITIGVCMSGNYVGKTPQELSAMSPTEIDFLRAQATAKLNDAGADYIIDSVADLPALLDELIDASAFMP